MHCVMGRCGAPQCVSCVAAGYLKRLVTNLILYCLLFSFRSEIDFPSLSVYFFTLIVGCISFVSLLDCLLIF